MSNEALNWASSWEIEVHQCFVDGKQYPEKHPGPLVSLGCARCHTSFHPQNLRDGARTKACPECGLTDKDEFAMGSISSMQWMKERREEHADMKTPFYKGFSAWLSKSMSNVFIKKH